MSSKLRSMLKGHKSAISRLWARFEGVQADAEVAELDQLQNIEDSLRQKLETIDEIHRQLLDAIPDENEDEIESEIITHDDYKFDIQGKVLKVINYKKVAFSNLNVNSQNFSASQITPIRNSANFYATSENAISHASNTSDHPRSSVYHRLPKLDLPRFDGTIIDWQSFWDSYESAIHSNRSLTPVQKFTYLRSLLTDDAAQTVAGFALTNANYERAVSLLHERFGQRDKIIDTYMKSLLDNSPPLYNLSSLRSFHDTTETYIRALESMGQIPDMYGSLLSPVIMQKLPPEIRRNMVREHGTASWSLAEVMRCLLKEITILDAGSTDKSQEQINSKTATRSLTNTSTVNSTSSVLHSAHPIERGPVILKTAVSTVSSSKLSSTANILFDEGAQSSFMSKALADRLELTPTGTETISLSGFADTQRRVRHLDTATVYLKADGGPIPIKVLIVPEISVPLKTYQSEVKGCKYIKGLKLAHPFTDNADFEIELLIGADHFWDVVQDHTIRGDGPTAIKSRIGYLLSGPIRKQSSHVLPVSMLYVMTGHDQEEVDLERFWQIEETGVDKSALDGKYDSYLQNYQDTCITYTNNKYCAKLPWKEDHPSLPTNESISRRRTENVINRLSQDPNMLQKYGEIICDQERRGFIEKVPDDQLYNQTRVHYIPHHPVKKDSKTTPIRVVYDCSCKARRES